MDTNSKKTPTDTGKLKSSTKDSETSKQEKPAPEIGGRPGPDPTRYGDWEKNGRCIDF